MLRLLWKEWHEVKWYLIGLVLAPWVLALIPQGTRGGKPVSALASWEGIIVALIFLFWAATRIPGELRARRHTLRVLPVSLWHVWVIKFLPGMIVGVLLPFWIQLIETWVNGGSAHAVVAVRQPLETVPLLLWLYTVGFSISTVASTAVAVILTPLIYAAMGIGIPGGIDDQLLTMMLAPSALCVSIGMWFEGSSGPRRRLAVGAISAALGFSLNFPVILAALQTGPGVAPALRPHVRDILVSPGYQARILVVEYYPASAEWHKYYLPSDDRICVAYTSLGANYPRDPTRADVLVQDSRGRRVILKGMYIGPMAWLPDGNLLIAAGKSYLEADLLEWDRRTNRIRKLASFHRGRTGDARRGQYFAVPLILGIYPDHTGNRIALHVEASDQEFRNLWMLERKTGRLRLIRPEFYAIPYGPLAPRWDGDRLVFFHSSEALSGVEYEACWSIRWDGSGLKRMFIPGRGD